jgi:hypothetical protein
MATGTAHPITFFTQTYFRNERKKFGIRQADRLAYMYIIGKIGTDRGNPPSYWV